MKTLCVTFLLVLFVLGCNGQVQVPTANLQPVIDSLAVLKARVAAVEARPGMTFPGNPDVFLNGVGGWTQAVAVKTGQVTFSGTAFRKAIYIQGLTTAWSAGVWPVYTSETPSIDYVVRKEIKPDSLIVLRQTNGTQNLTVEYIAILP